MHFKIFISLCVAGLMVLGVFMVFDSRLDEKFPDIAIQQTQDPAISLQASRIVNLSDQRRQHILFGDETGGGHFHGVGKPCKSEFPENWNEDKVIGAIELIAVNDNLDWRKEQNGYHVAEHQLEDLKIRVVLDKEKDDIITGYPVNVARNPCPANDN